MCVPGVLGSVVYPQGQISTLVLVFIVYGRNSLHYLMKLPTSISKSAFIFVSCVLFSSVYMALKNLMSPTVKSFCVVTGGVGL